MLAWRQSLLHNALMVKITGFNTKYNRNWQSFSWWTWTSCPARKTSSTLRLLSNSSLWHNTRCFTSSLSRSRPTSLSSWSSRRRLACTSALATLDTESSSPVSRDTSVLSRSLSSFSWPTFSRSSDTITSLSVLSHGRWLLTYTHKQC